MQTPRHAAGLAAPLAAATFAAALLPAAPVLACGGFFCSSSQLIAVEQKKERILFEVNPDETLTITVEISYTGSPEGFAWVIPVADTPALGEVPASALRLLDAATSPRIQPPSIYYGENWPEDDVDADGGDDDAAGDDDDGSVIVEDLPQVGPYDPTVVSSDDADALIDWLNGNGYLITEEMEPFVADYVSQGMKFLGLRLAPGKGVQDIAPISATYPGTLPSIPLILTAVSAEPEMSFLVFVAAAERYSPSNWADLEVPDELLQADPRTGANNYYPLLSYMADSLDGRAFFTEFADTTANAAWMSDEVWMDAEDWEESMAFLDALFERQSRITRLYTRASGEELAQDPVFEPAGTEAVSVWHEIPGEVCYDFAHTPVVACDETYCGMGGTCAVDGNGVEGCVCNEGWLARAISAPNVSAIGSLASVTCQDASFDLLASVDGPSPMDPCEGWDCGGFGECVVHAGMPTCDCNDGFVAIPLGTGELSCTLATETFSPEQVMWGEWPPPVSDCGESRGDDDDDTIPDDDDVADDDAADDDGGDDFDGLDGGPADCSCRGSLVASGRAGSLAGLLAALLAGGAAARRRRLRPARS